MKKKGFTLVEIMVSVIVLALLASGLFSVLVSARYLVTRSKARMYAIEIARSAIEQKKSLVNATTWEGAQFAPNGVWSAWDGSASPYRLRYRVDPGNGDYRKVTVQVAWDEQQM